MNFGLLSPLFLAGIAAVAIPILVHLIARREERGTAFPSLMFLRQVPLKRARRRTIRDPWLLALRMLAIALLALAFSRPYWNPDSVAQSDTGSVNQTVIAIDRSHSMQFGGRWERAITAARSAFEALPAGERGALIVFDEEPRTAVSMGDDRLRLRQVLDSLNAGWAGTDYARLFSQIAQVFDQTLGGERSLVLITDMQAAGLQLGRTPRLSVTTELDIVDVSGEPIKPTIISGVDVIEGGAETAEVTLRARFSAGSQANIGAPLELQVNVDGHRVESRELQADELALGSTTFAVVPALDRATRLSVTLGSGGAAATHRLALARVEPIRVVLLSNDGAATGVDYLLRALALGSQPAIDVRRVSSAALDTNALAQADLLIVVDAAIDDGGAIAIVDQFVRNGGGLLTFAGEHPRVDSPLTTTGLLPGVLGTELSNPARLTELVLPPRIAGVSSEQLHNAPVWRRRALQAGQQDAVLARFSDGAVALAERTVGTGRSLLFATSVGREWSSLALEPGFVPLTLALTRYLADRRAGSGVSAAIVGEAVDIARHAELLGAGPLLDQLAGGGGLLIESPGGDVAKIGAESPAYSPADAGFHQIHLPGGGGGPVPLAVNINTRELQLETLARDTFIAQIERTESATDPVSNNSPEQNSLHFEGWWYVLLAVTALLLIEGHYAAQVARQNRNESHA